jgi:dienelactone hydrolase
MRRGWLLIALLLVALLLDACGAGHRKSASPAGSRANATVDDCLRLGPETRTIELHPHGAPVKAVLIGAGTTVFVLSNESDQNLCGWLPFVRTLTAHHYAALLYDYLDPAELPADAQAGAIAARAAKARHIVLMGASVGARASIDTAATATPGIAAVISLSAERTVPSDPTDLLQRARRVTVPTLLISTRDDPFVNDATRPLLHALGSKRKRALILPGTDHGTSLLTDDNRRRVQAAILTFVATNSATR